MKASVYIATSLDGYIARENGDIDWLPGGDSEGSDEDYGFQEFMDSIDVLVMGRNTYEMVLSFGKWPYGNKPVVVLSSKPVQIPRDIAETVESKSCSPTELVKQLSERGAKHLYIDGGKTIQSFLNAGLIQQLIITRVPVLIGSGISLFGPLNKDVKLRHIETRSFARDLVQSRYEILGGQF
jgi:dihydrofolate reductase